MITHPSKFTRKPSGNFPEVLITNLLLKVQLGKGWIFMDEMDNPVMMNVTLKEYRVFMIYKYESKYYIYSFYRKEDALLTEKTFDRKGVVPLKTSYSNFFIYH